MFNIRSEIWKESQTQRVLEDCNKLPCEEERTPEKPFLVIPQLSISALFKAGAIFFHVTLQCLKKKKKKKYKLSSGFHTLKSDVKETGN